MKPEDLMKIGAEVAIQQFVKTGAKPTLEQVEAWVNQNWSKLAEGMVNGLQMASQ